MSKKECITQQRLVKYLETKRFLEEEKEKITEELKSGLTVEPGPVSAKLSKSKTRKPNWKTELMNRLGEEVIEEVIENTPEVEQTRLLVNAKKQLVPTNSKPKKKKKPSKSDESDTDLLDRVGGIW